MMNNSGIQWFMITCATVLEDIVLWFWYWPDFTLFWRPGIFRRIPDLYVMITSIVWIPDLWYVKGSAP